MYKFLSFLIAMLIVVSCNPTLRKDNNVIIVGTQALGDMPDAARNVDEYELSVRNVIDTTLIPIVTFNNSDDTLTLWLNYDEPADALPMEVIPSSTAHIFQFDNTDDIWDSDGDANLRFLVALTPGLWQARVTARKFYVNENNEPQVITAMSGRYDFKIDNLVLLKMYFRGIFK